MIIDEAIAETNAITDALGHPVDEHIKKLVTALHLHRIPTTSSCEGHLDHGEPYAWIDIGNDSGVMPYANVVDDQVVMEVGTKLQTLAQQADNLDFLLKPGSAFGDVTLINSGAAASLSLRGEQKQQALQNFQTEMNRFADYLIEMA
jgi:hypothetical protein